jgi:hypothetical protein
MTDIDKACEVVYERITGKCWHDFPDKWTICSKCSTPAYPYKGDDKPTLLEWVHVTNPPLATSLDAWAKHIWPVMPDEQWDNYEVQVEIIHLRYWKKTQKHLRFLRPIMHLEAALRALGETELAEKVKINN